MKNMSAKHVFWTTLFLWVLLLLPFFVPALNTLEPHILGLPFIVFYDFTIIGLHIVLLFICKKYVWDPFDAVDVKKGDSDK